jgi:RNA polymerase sigma factor (sigma-70 family)
MRRRLTIEHSGRIIALLNTHGERLYRLLVRLTLREDVAEDLLQDLVVKLAQARGFAAAARPYAYARASAVNLAFSWIRRHRRELAIEGYDPPAGEPPAWSKMVQAEEIQQMLRRMSDLGERDRLILTMRHFDEASYDEIGQALGCTVHQARGLCHKAVGRLRAAMTEVHGEKLETSEEVGP